MSIAQKIYGSLFWRILRPRTLRIWERADINRINREGIVIPCPYCGADGSTQVYRSVIDIMDHVGFFDNNVERLKSLYGIPLAGILPRKLHLKYIEDTLALIVGRSYVDYKRCGSCGLVFQNFPHTLEGKEYYYRELYRCRYHTSESDMNVYGRSDDRWIYQQELIGKHFMEVTGLKSPARVLDLGCAEGIVCKYLEKHSMTVYGLEPSVPMANYARTVLGLKNITSESYNQDSYPPEFFDGIITHHVAEHVVDIRGFLDSIALHLAKSGHLLFQVPCIDTLKTTEDMKHILQGGHIYCFSERFLVKNLEARGIEILDVKKTPCDLSELDASSVLLYETTAWGDDPCSITILGRKRP